MISGKKGLMFEAIMLIIIMIVLTSAFIALSKKQNKFKDAQIGERQFELINVYNKAEKALFYIDESAKYSAYQSIYNLSKNGICDNKYFGYSVWKFDNSKCSPDKELAKKKFISLFSDNLNGFLLKYESVKIPSNNYNLDFKDNNLIGLAIAPLKIPIGGKDEKTKPIGEYSIKPSFKMELQNYDFSDYDKLSKKLQDLTEACKNTNIDLCVNIKKSGIFNDESFELLDKCETEEKENFYKVAEYIESCSASKDNSCICAKNNPSVKGSFQISQEGNNAIISDKNNPELKEIIENVKLVDDYLYTGGESYAHKDQEGKVLVSGYWAGNQCEPEPKTKFRFCVKSKNHKFYAYDDNDKTANLRPVVYKFALDFSQLSGSPTGSQRNGILTGADDMKERIRQAANEIGFTNMEIALKLVKTESSFRHCRDGISNCGASNPDNVNCNSFESCGVMQVNNKPNAHEDLFIAGSKRLELFGCEKEETAYDLDCNIKSGLRILQQNYQAYGLNTDRYNDAVDAFCKNPELNAKYKTYTNPWDRALRAYNGFGCSIGADVAYVEKIDSAIV